MGVHTVVEAEAKEQLSELIDRALRGEEVRIIREGRPLLSLAVSPDEPESPTSAQDIDWLRRHRVKPRKPDFNGTDLLRAMRDGEV